MTAAEPGPADPVGGPAAPGTAAPGDARTAASGQLPPPGAELPTRLPEALRETWNDLRAALHERARLLTLELRLAGVSFVQLVLYAVMVAVLVISAWLGLVAGLIVGVVQAGVRWELALGVGILGNLVVAGWLVWSMYRLFERLDLPATLRRLQGHAAGEPPAKEGG